MAQRQQKALKLHVIQECPQLIQEKLDCMVVYSNCKE